MIDNLNIENTIDKSCQDQIGSIVVAGCGAMGLPMARCLQRSNFDVRGFDIRPIDQFGQFSSLMLTGAEMIRQRDVLISVVRDEQQTLALCFDQQGVFKGDIFPRILIVSSTVSPRFIRHLSERLPKEVELIDAPMSGAPHGATSGDLSFMLGGQHGVVQRLMPLFNAIGKQVFYCGESGAGMTMKVLNNYVAANTVAAVRRVYDMACALEVDHILLRRIMASSSGSTWFGDQFEQIEWSKQGYESGNTIGILEKDVLSALDAVVDNRKICDSGLDQAVLLALRSLKQFKT